MTGEKFLFGLVITAILLVCVPASASGEYTLGIFGNANEDDNINMEDVTYTERIILEYQGGTQLADAKYDGEIDILDITQIELIILGREKELTVLDSVDRIVTVDKPINTIVTMYHGPANAVKALGVEDKVVGVDSIVTEKPIFYPKLSKSPSIGGATNPDYELLMELKPDLVIQSTFRFPGILEEKLELAGIPLVRFDFIEADKYTEEIRKLGYILDRRDHAEEFIDWYEGYLGTIEMRTAELTDDEKPRVYFEAWDDYSIWCEGSGGDMWLTMAGGINIAKDLELCTGHGTGTVDPEWVIKQNPDIIIKRVPARSFCGYSIDDPSKIKALREDLMNRNGFEYIDAVKGENVYLISWENTMVFYPIGVMYMAKWLHPDLFDDFDPQEFHQEYLTKFHGLNYDLDEHGVFVYHPVYHPNGR